MNLTAIEEWIEEMGIPSGIQIHLAPLRDLLNWLQVKHVMLTNTYLIHILQCLSSITEFPDLVATIQTMKHINPLQVSHLMLRFSSSPIDVSKMRRAVRDYKYEVNEGRMTEECIQYLTQLQKDWERHRVKLGVEAMRKEVNHQALARKLALILF